MYPKGFDEIIQMHKAQQHTDAIYSTSDIVAWFESKGLTRGTASGTITRAVDQHLLSKLSYGEYQVNENYSEESSETSVTSTLKDIYKSGIDAINEAYPASKLFDMSDDDVRKIKDAITGLKEKIKDLEA